MASTTINESGKHFLGLFISIKPNQFLRETLAVPVACFGLEVSFGVNHNQREWKTFSWAFYFYHRIGEDTYRIKVGHGQFRERHESQLRVREPDLRGQHVTLSYAAHEADSDDNYAEQDDYTVEEILAQRPNASAPGGLEFKVRWRGYGPSHDTWEPVSSFVPRVNTPFMEYIRRYKTKIHVSDLAALTRAIAARGA